MGGIALRSHAELAHDQLATAPEVACGYRALRLVEDRDREAVAIANPEEALANDAVLAAEPCVGDGDPLLMDARLANIWNAAVRCRPKLQLCAFPDPPSDELWSCARAPGALLDAHQGRTDTPGVGCISGSWRGLCPDVNERSTLPP